MNNLKNVYIKAPKKTINNKNTKMIIKKQSLKKIDSELIKNNFVPINKTINYDKGQNFKLKNDIDKENKKVDTQIISSSDNDKIKKHRVFDKKRKLSCINKIKRFNLKKNKSKKKQRYVRLLIDSNSDVKGRMETKKKFHNILQKLSKKKLKKILVNKGLIKKHSKAPSKLLTDIYLNSKLLGDINVIQQ